MAKYQELSERALSRAMAMLGFLLWLAAVVWHGGMMQPSMMGYMYPGFSFIAPLNAAALLVVFVASGYAVGWLIAAFYNWNLKTKQKRD